jgi:hypothetical protein
MRRFLPLGIAVLLVGCRGEKPVEETRESRDAARQAANNWTPEMKANYEKYAMPAHQARKAANEVK